MNRRVAEQQLKPPVSLEPDALDHVSAEQKTRAGGSEGPKGLEHAPEDAAAPALMDDDKKRFRFFVGLVSVVLLVVTLTFGASTSKNDLETVLKGVSAGISPGTQMVSADPQMQARDYSVAIADEGGGPLELSIWDFADEDGDYVQVFVDGQPKTDPFAISHRATKVKVPSKGLIQVKGIRDGKGDGISYAVFFNKTGETYFNVVPLNATNTYTIRTAK